MVFYFNSNNSDKTYSIHCCCEAFSLTIFILRQENHSLLKQYCITDFVLYTKTDTQRYIVKSRNLINKKPAYVLFIYIDIYLYIRAYIFVLWTV